MVLWTKIQNVFVKSIFELAKTFASRYMCSMKITVPKIQRWMQIANLLKNCLSRGQRLHCLLILFLLFFFFFLRYVSPRSRFLVKPVFDRAEVRPAISGRCSSLRPWLISGTTLATFETFRSLPPSLSPSFSLSRRAFFRAFVGRKILAESSSEEAATWKYKKRCVMKALSLFGPDLISRVCASERASERSRVHFSAKSGVEVKRLN